MIGYLDPPLDLPTILRKKRKIRRALMDQKPRGKQASVKIALLAGSTVGEVKDILELFLLKEKLEPAFYESQFNRYYEESAFDNERLAQFGPDIAYLHTTVRNITRFPTASATGEEVEAMLAAEISRFRRIWTELRARYGCLIIQNNFELPDYRLLGNLDSSDLRGRVSFVTRLNQMIADHARENGSFFFVNDINYLSARVGLEKWFNKNLWYHYRYAMSYDAIPFLAQSLAAVIRSIYGRSKRCLVLDLDNTLWKGVVGDDGVEGIRMGEGDNVGEAYRDFQRYLKELKSRGVILAACSKNEHEVARAAFDHPDSVLRFEDFASFRANWTPKDHNLIEIAEELNLGLDSFVFVDDNPAEREIVRTRLGQVEVPEVGDEASAFIDVLEQSFYFEPTGLSAEDTQRSAFYEANRQRRELEASSLDYDGYLLSLEMTAEIRGFSPLSMERVTQLVNKTNQFNLTTKRCTRPQLEEWASSDEHVTLVGKLDDKFGTNGLVTVIVGEVRGEYLTVLLWVMSCRVFGRHMELAMFDELVSRCQERGIARIVGHFLPTKRNALVADLYPRLGFALLEETGGATAWTYDIPEDYEPLNGVIHCT